MHHHRIRPRIVVTEEFADASEQGQVPGVRPARGDDLNSWSETKGLGVVANVGAGGAVGVMR